MTVQELIDELLKIEDKSKKVVIRTAENWGYDTISYIEEVNPAEAKDCIAIWRE